MHPYRTLLCTLALAFAAPGCDAPPTPPEPSIEIGEKVEKLGAELRSTRAEASKRVDAAAPPNEQAQDAGPAAPPDAGRR